MFLCHNSFSFLFPFINVDSGLSVTFLANFPISVKDEKIKANLFYAKKEEDVVKYGHK